MFQYSNRSNILSLSMLLKPISNRSFPYFYSLMVLGVAFFKMFQKALYDLTSSRKDRQTNQDK